MKPIDLVAIVLMGGMVVGGVVYVTTRRAGTASMQPTPAPAPLPQAQQQAVQQAQQAVQQIQQVFSGSSGGSKVNSILSGINTVANVGKNIIDVVGSLGKLF